MLDEARARRARSGSCSRATTFRASAPASAASYPVPAPTISATSVRSIAAAWSRRAATRGSIRKRPPPSGRSSSTWATIRKCSGTKSSRRILPKAPSTRSSVTLSGRSWLSIMWARAASNTLIASIPANQPPSLYRYGRARTIHRSDIRSAWEPLERLFLIEPGEELLGCQSEQRVAPCRRYFGERDEHESAPVEPRMRQSKQTSRGHLPPMIEEIEIEDARRIRGAANAAKPPLDCLH